MIMENTMVGALAAGALILGALLWWGWHRGSIAKERLRGKQAAQRARYAQQGRGQVEAETVALTRAKPNFGRR
jgi:hypothetical protein